MASINCPYCGALVEQTDRLNSILACQYCSQTFLLEAKPSKATSLIQHDQTIKWRGVNYRTQGFIQFKHDEGYRTEWQMKNSNGEVYWLTVDDENLFLTQDQPSNEHQFPSWESLQVNTQLPYDGQQYLVTEKRLLHHHKTEGMLPSIQTAKVLKVTYLTAQNAKCLILIFSEKSSENNVLCRQGYWLDPFDIKVIT